MKNIDLKNSASNEELTKRIYRFYYQSCIAHMRVVFPKLSKEDHEDLFQNLMIKVQRNRKLLEKCAYGPGLIIKILRLRALDLIKSRNTQKNGRDYEFVSMSVIDWSADSPEAPSPDNLEVLLLNSSVRERLKERQRLVLTSIDRTLDSGGPLQEARPRHLLALMTDAERQFYAEEICDNPAAMSDKALSRRMRRVIGDDLKIIREVTETILDEAKRNN